MVCLTTGAVQKHGIRIFSAIFYFAFFGGILSISFLFFCFLLRL